MTPAARRRAVARRRKVALLALASLLAAVVISLAALGAPGAGAAPAGELVVQPSLGAPTRVFLGASPLEAPGETWATSKDNRTLARYTDAGGWDLLPAPAAPPGGTLFLSTDASAGRATPRGDVVAAAREEIDQELPTETLVVRDPGGSPRQASGAGFVLGGEELFGLNPGGDRMLAAVEGPGGAAAFTVPEGLQRVLYYDGATWSSEPLCTETKPGCEPLPGFYEIVAIDAAAGQGWLLARVPGAGLQLFHREGGGSPVWRGQALGLANTLGARLEQEEPGGAGIVVAPRVKGQALTVTAAGVWIDARLTDGSGGYDATVYFDAGKGEVTGSWCDVAAPALCSFPLGAALSTGQGRSFAWPPGGASGPYGTRTITGVGQGAVLTLEGTAFRRLTFVGGDAGSDEGAALSAPEEGWLGATPPLQLTRTPQAARLQPWPVPFRRPLTAIAPAPGKSIAATGSEALAVGEEGQVARYVPGIGWEPEFLLRSSGKRATPRLRGVAWPEEGIAYAVGDGAAMWRWQKATGLWQPDPGSPPNLARANLTGIAFDPANPSRGYAIGKQGVLLGYGRQWRQEALPPGVPPEANLTSIAFAGNEALVTWKMPFVAMQGVAPRYRGGVIVNDGSGWRVDTAAAAALGEEVPQRVAGLPDGGAVVVTLSFGEGAPSSASGIVIERQARGGAWQQAAGGSVGYPAGLAAVREGGQVRAIVSVTPIIGTSQGSRELTIDEEQLFSQPPPGQAPLLTDPYPLPAYGVLVRQTATGWRDEEQQTYPLPPSRAGQTLFDLPVRSDPALALLMAPDGSGGWAVGGDPATGVLYYPATIRTAAVMRYGPAAAPPANASSAPITPPAGAATFAIGAHAQCVAPCADFGGAGIGPDRMLRAAVARAAGVSGMRAFLYAGASVAPSNGEPQSEVPLASAIGEEAFTREQQAYARRLGSAAGTLPVFAAPSASDLNGVGTLGTFQAAFAGFGAPFGSGPAGAGVTPLPKDPGSGAYAFDTDGTGGPVRVVVLDYSKLALGDEQRCWLAGQLSGAALAGRPAIVVGERDLAGLAPNAAADRTQVIQTLVGAGAPLTCSLPGPLAAASAYFFDFPEENRAYRLSAAGRSIPAYGNGTLGYVTPPAPTDTDFAGAAGFLVVSVAASQRDAATNVAPVSVQLIPAIGSLALDATDGTLLRRSQPALFEGLARRPLAGSKCEGPSGSAPQECGFIGPPQYVPIPTECLGGNCASSVFPEYTFSSSRPDIADFVASDPGSTNPRNVLLVKKKPVRDPHSGLLCAFNAGTTTVTITTGGLSYSQKVTVQAGTVQRPCGTTPLLVKETLPERPEIPVVNEPGPETGELPPEALPPPPPVPVQAQPVPNPPAKQPTPPTPPTPITYFPIPLAPSVPLVPIVPPPPLPAVQPTPPSGTSQVNAVEEEEEPEEAIESSSAFASLPAPGPAAVSLRGDESGGGVPLLLPGVLVVAALATAAIGGGRRRRPRPAFQTTNSNRRYR